MLKKKSISYLGKKLDTEFWYPLEDIECTKLKEDYYSKPEFKDVEKELKNIAKGGVKVTNINNYYTKDIMAKVKFHHSKWSLEEVFNNNDLIRVLYGKTTLNKKVFPDTHSDIKKIETHIRLAGKGVACKPTRFPIKSVRDIISKYNMNDNYYDFSCGWGDRLLGAMSMNINYFGTDPNYLLVARLKELEIDYKKINKVELNVDIKTHGSEVFVPEWENTIGLAFSSPPYFNLEDYQVGEQSFKEGMEYREWLDGYMTSTIDNIFKYLIEGGYFCINVNNFGKYKLCEDIQSIIRAKGFSFICNHTLDNITRVYGSVGGNGGEVANNERIMVFRKV